MQRELPLPDDVDLEYARDHRQMCEGFVAGCQALPSALCDDRLYAVAWEFWRRKEEAEQACCSGRLPNMVAYAATPAESRAADRYFNEIYDWACLEYRRMDYSSQEWSVARDTAAHYFYTVFDLRQLREFEE